MNQEKNLDEIYCPSCAKPIKKDAVVCPNCGVQIKELKVSAEAREGFFCTNCGKSLNKNAAVCPYCGVAVKGGVFDRPRVSKDKTVALLLAIFLSFWTWIYTYEKDSWKFWLNLALTIVTIGFWGIVAEIWAIIDVATKPHSYYINFPNE